MSCHLALRTVDYSVLMSFLLTYYNSVFIDDTIMQESWVNYHRIIVKKIPSKLKIHRKGMENIKFLQEESQKHILEEDIEEN